MGMKVYSEEKKDIFIETAQQMGIGPALRHLKYPSAGTAYNWFKERDLEVPTVDSLQERARSLQLFYGDTEKKYAAQKNVERIVELLEQDHLTADDVKKLSDALHKAIQTFNLIDGKSVVITETQTKDGADLELIAMLKAQNELRENEFEG